MSDVKINGKELSGYLVLISAVATLLWARNQLLWHKVLKIQLEETTDGNKI